MEALEGEEMDLFEIDLLVAASFALVEEVLDKLAAVGVAFDAAVGEEVD